MKKIVLSLFVASFSSLSIAAPVTNDIAFIGAVNESTCDVIVESNGVTGNVVQLGTVNVNNTGEYVPFTIKAADPVACFASAADEQMVSIDMTSIDFDSVGLKAMAGVDAFDSKVLIKNAAGDFITKNNTINSVKKSQFNSDGMSFTAALQAGNEIGNFKAMTAFSVSYK
ncbi:hypothetical protein [Photobacterium leiognathi]|uniref:hypothetical protein n=1 Tax=Photobacterium leiognathi TaxID=553611 RepID=UPI0027330302|nr:hypothetical protein [Photobacterium leiognathi]